MLCKTHRRTLDNTIAKTNKDKQCHTKHIEERQTIPWPKPTRTNNVMQNTSKNVTQYHGKPTRTNNVIQNTSKNVRKYHDQSQQGQTMLYKTHRRMSDNTMAKTNNTKHIGQTMFIQNTSKNVRQYNMPKPTRTNNVIQNTSKNVRQYHGQNQQGQTMLYKTHRRTSDNTMAKTNKDKQCYTKHIEER